MIRKDLFYVIVFAVLSLALLGCDELLDALDDEGDTDDKSTEKYRREANDATVDETTNCAANVRDLKSCDYCYCTAKWQQCASNEACIALYNCLYACDSYDCEDTCISTYPNGLSSLSVYDDCRYTYCEQYFYVEDTSETVEDDTETETVSETEKTDVLACLTTNCTNEVVTCQNNVTCNQILKCVCDCDTSDDDCKGTCKYGKDAGRDDWDNLELCYIYTDC